MTNVLTQIKTADIYPHKDNPREDIGDIAELAGSIKANGVLQNLTVVPMTDGKYTVVIGHRRLAAAKLAGLETVPCIVSDMDEIQQIRTM
jgi:ParB family chromosome partitioning protein